MSILIKNMKMPKNCGRCWFNKSSLSCAITGSCIDRDDENRERLDDCPFVEVPKPHGRLIDADAINLDYVVDMVDDWEVAHKITNYIRYAPTVIEAEASDECIR